MIKRSPFLSFFVAVALLVAGALWFIQSQAFAGIFKQIVSKYLPADMGVQADFSEFAIQLYPPGLSLKNPRITLREDNILKMPAGSSVKADRIDFVFRPLQMLTGNIRVNELVITGGDLHLFVQAEPQSKRKVPWSSRPLSQSLFMKLHWDELFQIHAEAVVIRDSRAHVEWTGTRDTVDLQVKGLKVGQWLGRGGLGYELWADLTGLGGTVVQQFPGLKSLQRLEASAHVNALGARIDAIHLKGEGFETRGDGMIRGNLEKPQAGLNLDADLSANADIGLIARAMRPSAPPEVSGAAAFSGRVRGNLMKPFETLRLQGDFSAADLQYRKFHADEVQASGTWSSSPDGGEIDLEEAVITARDRPRAPGVLATGGTLRVGALRLKLGSTEPVQVKLGLEKARLQWLAALAVADLKQIYPVQLKATGPIEATLTPPTAKRPLKLQAQLKLHVDDFLLDNQKLNQVRPLQRIFQVPALDLAGPLSVDSAGLKVDGMALTMPRTKLALSGRISEKGEFGLRAAGPVDLSDLGEVAEKQIRGTGNVAVLVHGPAKKLLVDIDVDLKDAYYIRLGFGDVRGRLTWDDDPNHLIFRKVHAQRGTTEYVVDGMVDASHANSIALSADIPKGNMQEFVPIFQDLTKELWWFPQSISGPFSGHVDVTGGLRMPELRIAGRISGATWDYLGERFDQTSFSAGYDRGKYYVSDFRATKRTGRITGRISYVDPVLGGLNHPGEEGEFDWQLHTQQMTVSDLDHVAQLDVPIRGKISLDSAGKGREGAIESESQAALTDFSVRGASMPPSRVTLRSSGGVHRLEGTALGEQGSLDVSYDFNPTHPSRLRAELNHLDFTPALLLLNPANISDPNLSGHCSASIDLVFRSGQIERADGQASLTEYRLAKSGTRFELDHPVSFRIRDGSFDIGKLVVADYGAGQDRRSETRLALKSREAALDGSVSGNVDLSALGFVTSEISRPTGQGDLDFAIGGTIKAPTLSGGARVEGAGFFVQGLESPFENVSGALSVRQNEILVQDLEADLAGGRASAGGTILVFADRYPQVNLKAELSGNKLRFFPFQYANVRGALSVTGSRIPYLVQGSFKIDSALSKQKMFEQEQTQGLKAAEYTPPPSADRLSDYPKFKLKIDAEADRGILVQNDLFDAEFKAKLTVVNTIEVPRLLGTVDLVQGHMTFKDRIFQIESANAVFDNPTVIDPKFSINAKTDIKGTRVDLYASGSLDNYKVDLSSTPALSESDILSLLAIGVTPSDTRQMSSVTQSTIESGEAASMLLHSLDFNREVQDKTGFEIQLDESTNPLFGISAFRPATGTTDNVAAPKIVIKKQLTPNFDVSYGSTVGAGDINERVVNAEMRVTSGFSLIGVWDNYATTDTTLGPTNNYSYGVDLRLQKRFK